MSMSIVTVPNQRKYMDARRTRLAIDAMDKFEEEAITCTAPDDAGLEDDAPGAAEDDVVVPLIRFASS